MRTTALVCLLVVSSLATAQEAATYRWIREITIPAVTETSVAAAPLDAHVFRETRDGRTDLRIIDPYGEPQGFVIRPATERKSHTRRSTWTAEQVAVKVDPTIGLQIELKLRDKEPVPSGLQIVTPLANFEHQVLVETSTDGVTWTTAGPTAMIFDYSKYVDARSDLVPMVAGEQRRFRVTIADPTAEQESQLLELHRRLRGDEVVNRDERTMIERRPFRVERIEFYRDTVESDRGEPVTTTYPETKFAVEQDIETKQTFVLVDMQYEPISEITLATEAKNFSRSAVVEAWSEDHNGNQFWRKIAGGTLTRFSIGKIQRDEVRLKVPVTYTDRYRIVIENRDSAPLPITSVTLTGPVMEVVFLVEPGQTRELEYGSPDSKAGQYDTAALSAVLATTPQIVAAELQPPRDNTNAPVRPARLWKPWQDKRVLVGTGLALTLLLGWGLFQASRRILPPVE